MKSRLILITLCFAVFSFGLQAKVKDAKPITGKSLTTFGKYTISPVEFPMVIKGEEVKTYELNYANCNRAIQIGVVPEKNCTNFIMKCDQFEIEYVCKKGVFGVKKMSNAYSDIPKDMNEAVLDRFNYLTQRVISQKPKTENELLGLIACYFPKLIKEEYQQSF